MSSAIATAPFDPCSPGELTISAPYIWSSCVRSAVTLSGMTTFSG
jgi:hypothetical protein